MQRTHNNAQTLTLALAATTAMWMFTYIALLFSGKMGGEVLFVLVALCIPCAASIAARHGASISVGGKIGFLSAIINLLLVGSIVGGQTQSETVTAGLLWAAALITTSVLLGCFGTWAGSRMRECHANIDWRFAFFTAASTLVFLMLITGGLVTGMEAGLAVPDWPNSYGHNMLLYPLTEMVSPEHEGVFFEHAHRLTGMFVGLTSLIMVSCAWLWSTDKAVRFTSLLVFILVCLQGLLGGLRVTEQNLPLAMVHGVVGQLIFAGFVWIAAMMSPSWQVPHRLCNKRDRLWANILGFAMVLQLVLGALYRHMISDADLAPKASHVITSHIVVAIIVLVLAVIVGLRSINRGQVVLKRCGIVLLILVSLQLLLGGGALVAILIREGSEIPLYELLLTTAHQANGAMLLAATFLTAAWICRMKCV